MQPTDQTSMALVYSFHESMISGARYHRVATYSVMNPEWFSSGCATRASPKSHTCQKWGGRALSSRAQRACGRAGGRALRLQLPLRSRLLGLRSRCSTCAE